MVTGKIAESLYGNDEAKEYFRAAIESGTLSHAYLIEGAKGSGRHTLVRGVLLSLIDATSSADGARKRAESGSSPDIVEYALAEKKRTIGVDTVRELREKAFILPSELEFRAFIISSADALTVSAQNAALKILEEPPENVYFFLLCENVSSLLPTVRSRAQTVRMEKFSPERIGAYLESNPKFARINKTDPERCRSAIRASDGSIGRVLAALEGAGRGKNAELAEALVRAFCSNSSEKILKNALLLPSSRSDADEVLLMASCALRDLCAAKSGAAAKSGTLFFPDRKSASELAGKRSERAIFSAYDGICTLRENIALNINMTNARASLARALLIN